MGARAFTYLSAFEVLKAKKRWDLLTWPNWPILSVIQFGLGNAPVFGEMEETTKFSGGISACRLFEVVKDIATTRGKLQSCPQFLLDIWTGSLSSPAAHRCRREKKPGRRSHVSVQRSRHPVCQWLDGLNDIDTRICQFRNQRPDRST